MTVTGVPYNQVYKRILLMNDILNSLLSTTAETEILEFKEAKNTFSIDKLGQYLSALGNEANLKGTKQAYLILGVNNDRKIVGTNISDDQINKMKQEVSEHTSPTLSFVEVHRIKHPIGNVLIFEIPAAPAGIPIAWKSHRYGRNGESLSGLNDIEYGMIYSQLQQKDWSKEIIKEATLKDLDDTAIAKSREEYASKNKNSLTL